MVRQERLSTSLLRRTNRTTNRPTPTLPGDEPVNRPARSQHDDILFTNNNQSALRERDLENERFEREVG